MVCCRWPASGLAWLAGSWPAASAVREVQYVTYRQTSDISPGFEISNWMHLSIGQVDCKNQLSECIINLSEIYKANATYVKIRNAQSVGQVLQVFQLSDCHFYLSQTIGQVKFRTLKLHLRQYNCWSFRCNWSSRGYIFILDLTPSFNELQDCSIFIANALEILQSCTKPAMWSNLFCCRYLYALVAALSARKLQDPALVESYYYQQNDVCMLRLFEAFLESCPQLTLQLYIMVATEDAHWLTGLN